jgi:hypothetical protein
MLRANIEGGSADGEGGLTEGLGASFMGMGIGEVWPPLFTLPPLVPALVGTGSGESGRGRATAAAAIPKGAMTDFLRSFKRELLRGRGAVSLVFDVSERDYFCGGRVPDSKFFLPVR